MHLSIEADLDASAGGGDGAHGGGSVRSLAVDAGESVLLSGSAARGSAGVGGAISVWNLRSEGAPAVRAIYSGHVAEGNAVREMGVWSGAARVASCDHFGALNVWDLHTARTLHTWGEGGPWLGHGALCATGHVAIAHARHTDRR